MGENILLNVAATMSHSRANGPGVRAVLWVQGCTIGCPGCYNTFTHVHEQRTLATPDTIAEWVSSLEGIEGVSFSGGEPFEQAKAVRTAITAIRLQNPNLTFFAYSGFDLAVLEKSEDEDVIGLLNELDMISAGPYVHSKRQTNLLWRGSSNQKLHYLSDAYSELHEKVWSLTSPVEEFHLNGEVVHFTGFEGRRSSVLRTINKVLRPIYTED